MLRFLTILSVLLWSGPSFAQNHSCESRCLARGGMPNTCARTCGVNKADTKRGVYTSGRGAAIETHGSYGTTPPNNATQGNDILKQIITETLQGNPQNGAAIAESLKHCVDVSCKTGLSGQPLEQCIANCRQAAILEGKSQGAGGEVKLFDQNNKLNAPMIITPQEKKPKAVKGEATSTGLFSDIDFDCFKTCRTEGDGFATCKTVCAK